MTASSWSWKVCIFMSWFVAVFLGVFPILKIAPEFYFPNFIVKTSSGIDVMIMEQEIDNITCSLVRLNRSNYSNHELVSELEYLNKHFSRNAAQYQLKYFLKSYSTYQDFKDHRDIMKLVTSYYFIKAPTGKIGFYSFSDTCLPKLFVHFRQPGWEYSIAIITLNLTCFMFIAVSYVLIYIRSTKKRKINAASTVDLQKREAKIQKRIAIIIITDFARWVPICIMAFVVFSGWFYGRGLLAEIAAGFLLPINSALNPFLYSIDLDKLSNRLRCPLLKKCRN